MKLLQELFTQGILSEGELNESKETIEHGQKTEEELILEKKLILEEELFELKSKVYKIPLKKINAENVPALVLELMPEEASANYKMSPIARTDDSVEIGMVYPENIAAQNALRFLAGQQSFNYKVFLISFKTLADLLKQRKNISSETKRALDELSKEKKGKEFLVAQAPEAPLTEDAPIIKMVSVILRHAIEGSASDIHIEPSREKLTVRFRLNGILHPTLFLPLKVHPSIVARIKILSGLKIDENRVPQDGRFTARIDEKDLDFRVSTFPTLYGEKVEIRVLDSAAGEKSFGDLGLDGRNLEVVQNAITKPYGMVLFTGPTGSGKTTTQYAILRTLNKDSVNVVTVEDPIEYSIAGVNQSQVKPEIGYTFARGLRQILRQDPNVIMIGEVRDEETADLVINAALTGHIVLSTLHTNSSVGVIPRLIDMGVRPFLIPSTLRLVIAQRLIRVLCQNCKTKVRPSEKVKNYILSQAKNMPAVAKKEMKITDPLFIYKAKGCEKCNFSGYTGRMGLFEILTMSDELAELIQKNPLETLILKVAQKQGMLTIEQEGILKVLNGHTSIEEIARVTGEKD